MEPTIYTLKEGLESSYLPGEVFSCQGWFCFILPFFIIVLVTRWSNWTSRWMSRKVFIPSYKLRSSDRSDQLTSCTQIENWRHLLERQDLGNKKCHMKRFRSLNSSEDSKMGTLIWGLVPNAKPAWYHEPLGWAVQLSWKDAELKNSQRNLTNVKKDCEVGSYSNV